MAQASSYTKEDGETICAGLAEGHSLLEICQATGISYEAAKRWEKDVPQHATDSARAREIGCHALAEQCLRIADTPLLGEETTTKADGSVEIKTGDMLGHRRLQIDTRMRLLGKWLPKVYGEKLELGGEIAHTQRPFESVPTEQLKAALEKLGINTK